MKTEKKTSGRSAKAEARAMPRISDAEWVVMKVAWETPPVTANQVVQALEHKMHWKPKTIHTLLARLVQKGALDCDKSGREYLFQPSVEAKDCLCAASRSFLSRFFDGQVAPFLACFLEHEKLSREEIEELRRILEAKQ